MKRLLIGILSLLTASAAFAQDRATIDRAIGVMREVAERCPRAYGNAHRDDNRHPEAWDFVVLATQELKRRVDPAIGMNGKRGNPNDPSSDALAYGSGASIRIVDFLIGAGEHGHDPGRLTWHDVTAESTVGGRVMGVYIDPDSKRPVVACGATPTDPVDPPPPPPPPSGPNLQSVLDAIAALNARLDRVRLDVAAANQSAGDAAAAARRTEADVTVIKADLTNARARQETLIEIVDLARRELAAISATEYKGGILGIGITLRPHRP